jgi:hypothetical protein
MDHTTTNAFIPNTEVERSRYHKENKFALELKNTTSLTSEWLLMPYHSVHGNTL